MSTTKAFSALLIASYLSLGGCAATSHPTAPAAPGAFGVARASSSLEQIVDEPGPVTVETVVGATWQVPLSGLVNLDNPKAKAAHLVDRDEPIDLFVHVVRHPQKGMFLIDTGVEHAFLADPSHAVISGMMGSMAHLDKLKVLVDTASLVKREGAPVQGVFLTHMHLDHVLGMRDVAASTPIFVGAGDAEDRSFMNLFESGIYNTALEGKASLQEVQFEADPDGTFAGVRDVFGDGSFWAISVPGHTPGSIAYVARTPTGPVLLTGDACHSAWGWEHGVEPGTFSDDVAKGADSLARLQGFVARHPKMDVRLGHQQLVHGS
jgi:N-acyl homoserine lactone hydrolase